MLWNLTNKLKKSTSNNKNIPNIHENDIVINSVKEKANAFNNFFSNIDENMNSNIENNYRLNNKSYMSETMNSSIRLT